MSEEEKKKVNIWDVPSAEDGFGREPFVDTIVKTIQSSDEGFNLGISARWGEGKSSILKQLKPKLEKLNYKVLTFEPWKYTQDQISIKRKFIIDIYSQLGKDYDASELYRETKTERDPDNKEYDAMFSSKLVVILKYGGLSAAIFLFGLVFVKRCLGVDINITKTFLDYMFIPIFVAFLPLIQKMTEITVTQVNPKIESAEQFEKLFNKAIDGIMTGDNCPARIVIFVDDLDRCNHTEVEQILTALFTFFNNPHCTYIITADHTVIQRYISEFLKLDDELDKDGNVDIKKTHEMRQKEATEYLKKIFQINFIVPKISSDLLEKMIRDLLDASPIISPKNPYAKEYLLNMILTNFQGNPRKIKHFIRTLAFQLEAISEKILAIPDGESEDEKKNLNKVKNSPELLAKILIVQDRFPDFYEKIVAEPKLVQKHEEGDPIENKDLQNLLAQEPKFFNSVTRPTGSKTIDPYYFLYFSGSTGYVETNAVDPAEVKAFARSADFGGLTKIISGLTDEPRNAQVELIKKEFDVVPAIPLPEKVNVVRSLFHAVSLIEEPVLRLQNLKDILDSRAKYTVEFASLQALDFAKFITFADIEAVNHLFADAPFTTIEIQTQILEAFIQKQTEMGKGEIADRFIQAIADGIRKMHTTETAMYLNVARRLTPDNFTGSELLHDSIIQAATTAGDPTVRKQTFDSLFEFSAKLSPAKKAEFENHVLGVIEKDSIADVVALLSGIPEKINQSSFDLWKLVTTANKRLESLNQPELEQMINILLHHPAVNKELGSKNTDRIIMTLVGLLNSSDASKQAYVRAKLPDFVIGTEDKKALLNRLVRIIESGPVSESLSTLSILQSMHGLWAADPKLKKEFAEELKSGVKRIKDKEIKDAMTRTSNELVPPLWVKKDDPASLIK